LRLKVRISVLSAAEHRPSKPAIKQPLRVTVALTDGEANKAVIELLAKTLGIPKSNIEILSGGASRQKRVAISGLEPQQISDRLTQKGRERTSPP
jgi:uncharacterized protein YggU (UPF0235/DUF167 family)